MQAEMRSSHGKQKAVGSERGPTEGRWDEDSLQCVLHGTEGGNRGWRGCNIRQEPYSPGFVT